MVISRQLARDLRDAGLPWTPEKGDWFVVLGRGLDDQEFLVGTLDAETQALATDPGAVWMPYETQLRELLGEAFIGLEHIPGETPGFAVSMLVGDTEHRFVDIHVEEAYGRAALALLVSMR